MTFSATPRRRLSAGKTKLLLAVAIAAAVVGAAAIGLSLARTSEPVELPYSMIPSRIIELSLPAKKSAPDDRDARRAGGLIAVDLNGDGNRDFIVTRPGLIASYDSAGQKLWTRKVDLQVTRKAERDGLPGTHAPGVQAADVDQDGSTEILFLTRDNTLHIVDGHRGETKWQGEIAVPEGAARWEHVVVADFRGHGDRDVLLQATNAEGYRMGRYLAAYAVDDLLRNGPAAPLWTRDDFVANAHNGARLADLDGDGRDEVLGATIVGPDGALLFAIPLYGHVDSLFVADVRPDLPGLEVVALEEGGGWWHGNRVFLYNQERLIWQTGFRRREPQNAAIGDFDPKRPGLEVWCRSRFDEHQTPFVFDAYGDLIEHYEMDDVAPVGWTIRGVEVIAPVHWRGNAKQLAAAKERHREGDVALFDPLSGRFIERFQERAERLYVADVTGDWREELIVLNGSALRIYENPEPNPNVDRPRLWTESEYRRSKMTWNYYNP